MSLPPNTRCLVTGASDTLSVGYAAAHALLEAGAAAVAITGRHGDKLQAAAASLEGAFPGRKIVGLVSDLAKPETMEETVKQAVEQLGGAVSILVVSGGNGGSEWLGLDAQDPASYRLLQDVAVLSPMKLTHSVIRHRDATSPETPVSIVMVSSSAANTPWPDTCPFNVTKAAQNCMVQQLAFQYRSSNVRINAVLAGCIHTGALDVMAAKKNVSLDEYAALRAGEIPMQRNGTPQDVAQAILWLASPTASSFCTGILVPVDGGLHLSNWFNKPKMLAEFQGNAKLGL